MFLLRCRTTNSGRWSAVTLANSLLSVTANDGEQLLIRSKGTHDMSLPAGNSVAACNLLRLEGLTANPGLAEKAAALMQAFAGQVVQSLALHTQLISALDFAARPSFEVVISGTRQAPDTLAMLRALRQPFLPNKVVIFRPSDASLAAISKLAPYIRP